MKTLRFALLLSIAAICPAQDAVVRATDPRGTAGQALISNGAGSNPSFQDPIISFNYVTLFNAQAATGTATSSAIRLPALSAVGSLVITGASITGSPAGCQIALRLQHQAGAPASSDIATQAFTPGNSYQTFAVIPSAANSAGDTLIAVYTCTTYPTAGTISVGFDSLTAASIVNALPTGTNTIGGVNLSQYTPVSGRLPVDGSGVTQPVSGTVTANQGGAPWSQNLTQLNSVALASPFDLDSGAGTQNITGISLRKSASGGSVELGTSTDPLRVDPTGTTTQPVNAAQWAGVTALAGNGVTGTGSPRVTLSSDNSAIAGWGLGARGSAPPSGAQLAGGITSGLTGGLMEGITLCDQWVAINGTASAQLITGVASRKIYFCNGNIQMNGGANTVSFVSGTGTTCATGITAVPGFDGSTTAANGYSFAANSGMSFGGGSSPFARTTNNADNFCILVGSATRVVGGLSYAIY